MSEGPSRADIEAAEHRVAEAKRAIDIMKGLAAKHRGTPEYQGMLDQIKEAENDLALAEEELRNIKNPKRAN